jgi:hypothetical protein
LRRGVATVSCGVGFTPDDRIEKIAQGYSLDAVDFFRDQFHIALDWSDASIKPVETVMETFHREFAKAKPLEEQVQQFAKLFGSYIGEVYRKNHGATWGMVDLNGQRFAGLQKNDEKKTLFWPWVRARSRLVDGEENNVWDYYRALIEP